jgi:hypothetical protein
MIFERSSDENTGITGMDQNYNTQIQGCTSDMSISEDCKLCLSIKCLINVFDVINIMFLSINCFIYEGLGGSMS